MINENEIREISLEEIIPNRFQPRELFNEEALNELSASIKEHGVLQPIIVRPVGDKYEIIAGERRYKASELAGKTAIPCIVREYDDIKSSQVALLENLQRKDLTPIEEARTYQTILKISGVTQDELAKNLGKSQSAIANKLRLLNLDEDVQNALLSEQISERHARSLLNIEDKEKQKELLNDIIQTRMTVKELDEEIAKIKNNAELTTTFIEKEEESVPQGASNNMFINSEEIKNSAFDINPANVSPLSDLLNNSVPKYEPEQPKTESSNMFIPNMEEQPINLETEEETDEGSGNTEVLDLNEIRQAINATNIATPQQPSIIDNNYYQQNQPQNAYDLRFAINNIRQAVQATEKFGFVLDTEEFDFENMYQIIIKIDKNK